MPTNVGARLDFFQVQAHVGNRIACQCQPMLELGLLSGAIQCEGLDVLPVASNAGAHMVLPMPYNVGK